jgi:hypothetical protein
MNAQHLFVSAFAIIAPFLVMAPVAADVANIAKNAERITVPRCI